MTKYARQALRTILVAYKDIEQKPLEALTVDKDIESDLIIIGLAGIKDPLRPEIRSAVAKCAHAGVTVRMVTGDNVDTAVAIAKEAGILERTFEYDQNDHTQKVVMLGDEFERFVGGLQKHEEFERPSSASQAADADDDEER